MEIRVQETKSSNGDSIVLITVPDLADKYQVTETLFFQRRVTAFRSQSVTDTQTLHVTASLSANRSWLVSHAGQYAGQWIALRNGVLLGVADSLSVLADELRTKYSIRLPSDEIMITTGF
jgi:hypothetical protein